MRKSLLRVLARTPSAAHCNLPALPCLTVKSEYISGVNGSHGFPTSKRYQHTSPRPTQDSVLRPRWFDLSPHPPPSDHKNGSVITSGTKNARYLLGPEEWASQLDQYLPKELRSTADSTSSEVLQADLNIRDVGKILTVLTNARSYSNVDILAYMSLSQGRYKAVLYLVDLLLQPLARSADDSKLNQLPSNIKWPISFIEPCLDPVELDSSSYTSTKTSAHWENPFDDATASRQDEKVMQFILPLLAKLTIAASQLAELEAKDATHTLPENKSKDIMRTVHQLIARLHNLGLVPQEMYNYSLPKGTTNVQRPPILHLLSSRILSTVSDAVWRSHQDEAIERAVKQGMNYKQISQDVPGGRFRLKVRELGPEVWLEFLLWYCVDGGYASAGARIINILRDQNESPWYAVHWCSNHGLETPVPQVDWDKAKIRLGGTAGRLEGYSAEEPFAHIPHQTISAEVVLALVECLFNSVNTGIRGSGLSLRKFQQYMTEVISFLEPHALGPEYFNYLTVRFLETGSVHIEAQPDVLRNWYKVISQLRSLETIKPQAGRTPSLNLERIAAQTELQAGILHQALQGYINQSNATQAVNCFTDIQRHVDTSRLESIGTFLTSPSEQEGVAELLEGDQKSRLDFLKSHGQLPIYKRAAFLNLVTNTRLFGLGQWLLDSVDVDGPLIPKSVYHQLCMTVSLTKYADASGDYDLIKEVMRARKSFAKLKPSVNVLRAIVNALISVSDWSSASDFLRELKIPPGGGYSPKTVARLGAKIIQAESQLTRLEQNTDLVQATELLCDILSGVFDGARADFTLPVKKVFDQQVGYLLRLFENLPPLKEGVGFYIPDEQLAERAHLQTSRLSDVARMFKPNFPLSNEANLAPETFNDVLSAIVEHRGAVEGVRMWNLFCKDPRSSAISEKVPLLGEYVVPEVGTVDGEDGDEDVSYVLRSKEQMPQLMDGYVPIIATGYEGPKDQMPRLMDGNVPTIASGYEESDIPLVDVHPSNTQAEARSFNPIVVPNLRTLHIIVRAAIAEKRQLKGLMLAKEAKLDKVLYWARDFYKALNCSARDFEGERHLSQSLLKGENHSQTQLKWLYDKSRHESGVGEIDKPDIRGMFTAAAPLTRLPGVERP